MACPLKGSHGLQGGIIRDIVLENVVEVYIVSQLCEGRQVEITREGGGEGKGRRR